MNHDAIRQLLETRSSFFADLAEDESMLVHSDLTGTRQLYEMAPGDGELRQLTDLPEPVGTAAYIPGTRRAVIEVDRGGNERHQLYLLDLDAAEPAAETAELVALTADDRHGHHLAGVSPDGTLVAYVSNRRNGIDFDLWLAPLAAGAPGGKHRLSYGGGGWCQPASGFSPDGRFVSVLRPGPRPLDDDLLLVETGGGGAEIVLPHPDEGAAVGAPAWLDTSSFLVASNLGSDLSRVLQLRLDAGGRPVGGGDPAALAGVPEEVDAFPVTSPDGSRVLVVANVDGESRATLHESAGGALVAELPLAEAGVLEGVRFSAPRLSRDGRRVYYSLSTPRLAGDVWCFDAERMQTRRLTTSPAPVPPEDLVGVERHLVESFDGEQVPLFLLRPAPSAASLLGELPPAVVYVHGGPEGQSTLQFNPVLQALAGAGFAVVVPNVRGSVGYGKRYAALDDTTKRLDSVRDLAAVHGWLTSAGLDAGRAALWGGSYGGYMVLAGLAFQPELWAAGVDIVGISDLVTFLTNTSDYRRAHRELEYGSLERDREFLEQASPLRSVDRMRAPLFVIHGRNDPRVPVSEAEQLVGSLSQRGVRCELVVYEDEGHGLARLANRLDAYPRAIEFLAEVLAVA